VPVLVSEASAGNIILQYPSWASGFTLESSTSLPATSWNVVNTPPIDIGGGVLQVTLSASGAQEFFRLRSP
jgi:hypothetical protein